MKTAAYAATAADRPLAPFAVERREPGPRDVAIDILYCGLCHSDIMQVRNELGRSRYPLVPGHEIVGRVAHVGAEVTRVKAGDIVGVGGMVDSCRECFYCHQGHEQFCQKGAASTYNGTEMDRKTVTYGGYSKHIVVTEAFVLKIPSSLDPAAAAPLLCAGITTYSPLRQWNVKPGDRVGVVGLGGLGHLAVKIAAAMGAEVTMLSTSRAKEADAQRLGARHFVLTTEPDALDGLAFRFDLVLDTVASPQHDYAPYLGTLKPFGTLVVLGLTAPSAVSGLSLIMGNKRVAGSAIGGIRENQEMLDFCGEHGIVADIETISAAGIEDAYARMIRNDVRYRFVLDAATI
ncbi:NAD(P)-dependent alcohol dehydrogenase [Nannocystis pusilla]|uniref:NAD(P)-dependent alcohol dehydrogenase n=1 Tax=Nannocystis pusilla TaxID=889268 RepID=A0A9X3IX67_9BACT|nr:NAD(P)-dependent alcohol dehydrogenase [Nannocystis pusilla]MCY1008127.1 NAD(P)-dependent alcohol dehydrogenase [Nannocystis pusilla]